ncbi:AMP-binding protein [Mycolicibacterium aichiense]|uniref:Cyclohexanecarboxylate-CoA ligase n=1 Tax=Mycolicibacterium aichiense TaxID=1799 RepID=A0AAD1HNZ9_9MYCO|nr:AMP-binding protein [Mycolicibacterium aichiense]MCV7019447.1 AMP-binding protein [Mycolicibacterium aichiense]BBX08244.1 cyclohexanecarboxylate-CoA ligase [Mycolicibacterium aichiense]STZ82047.1 AMP-dependent synthetase and ligase [Mycolicibacterium aichiense]
MRSAQRDAELATRAYASGSWVHDTLADALAAAARDTPRREVIVDGPVRLDCATLHDRASRLAGAMLTRMPAGSVVSFMLPNWHEAAIVYHAATVAGMVVNPILPSLRDHELAFILADADVRMIFVPGDVGGHDYAAMLQRVTATLPDPPVVIVVRGGPLAGQFAFDSLPSPPAPAPTLDPDAVRMILYTSGTTGRPKGVLHSHNSIHALIRQIGGHWLIDPGSAFLVPSPIAHIGGSIYAFECPVLLGTTAVLMDRWDADEAVARLTAEHCTHMAGATPFLQAILAAAQRANTRLPDLRVFICGGASVPPQLIRTAADYFEQAMVTRVYGSTEVPVTTIGAPDDRDHAADTDGRPGIADVTIVDGEIRARGPQMLLGYLHPDDDTDAFDADGYFRTGDLGHWVGGRYLVVTGRAKDIVIRNGENIAPKEIEDVLLGHPGINEIAIVGVPDPRTGERACAVIVTDRAPGPDVGDLRDYLQATGVAKFKWPEQVVVWDALPKNDAGKVLKHRIRARLVDADE